MSEERGRAPVNVATEVVRQVLDILERASDTWHNGGANESGPLHWPVAVSLARRAHPRRAYRDCLWKHLTPAQRLQWLRRAQSEVPADAWEAFKGGDGQP
jgi:hypothetical protein